MNKITKKTVWGTYEGVFKPLDELETSHLINIISHINKVKSSFPPHISANYNGIIDVSKEILTDRGIEHSKVLFIQSPHRNKDGKLAYWDSINNKELILQK